ncbi:hypothetical protein N9954_09670, partial [Maribacter sp.]|nr:hypothetical protein [Maribacter sp.]
TIRNRPYFYYYRNYYVKSENGEKAYEVVDAPIGMEIDALADGYEIVKVGEIGDYKFENTFDEPRIGANDEQIYIAVNNLD